MASIFRDPHTTAPTHATAKSTPLIVPLPDPLEEIQRHDREEGDDEVHDEHAVAHLERRHHDRHHDHDDLDLRGLAAEFPRSFRLRRQLACFRCDAGHGVGLFFGQLFGLPSQTVMRRCQTARRWRTSCAARRSDAGRVQRSSKARVAALRGRNASKETTS